MRAERRRLDPNGFTLVEVLVALVAASLLLSIVMNGALTAKERERLAGDKRQAVLMARDLITHAGAEPFAARVDRGREGQFAWEVNERVAVAEPRGRFILVALAVTVKDRADRLLVRLETRRLKAASGR